MKTRKNNGIFYVVIALLAVLAVGGVASAYVASHTINVADGGIGIINEANPNITEEELNFTAFPGPDVYADVNIHGTFTYGGGINATSSAAVTQTLVMGDLLNYSYIDVMNNKEALTWTLPATSTMISMLPEDGSTRSWLFHNATSTELKTLTFAAGAGMDLVSASSTSEILDAGDWAVLECTNIYYRSADDTDIMCGIEQLVDAD